MKSQAKPRALLAVECGVGILLHREAPAFHTGISAAGNPRQSSSSSSLELMSLGITADLQKRHLTAALRRGEAGWMLLGMRDGFELEI